MASVNPSPVTSRSLMGLTSERTAQWTAPGIQLLWIQLLWIQLLRVAHTRTRRRLNRSRLQSAALWVLFHFRRPRGRGVFITELEFWNVEQAVVWRGGGEAPCHDTDGCMSTSGS
ncbi:unnamed protein product [Pleuronectes platessa]|uniref:Uncharacterized protein n=1 Tax=Pleuronectes platessa TaxID=8262 RepID=A0A9N7YPT0_PLEPL|nr:unnamed protein product [Pleuronectes platessa]